MKRCFLEKWFELFEIEFGVGDQPRKATAVYFAHFLTKGDRRVRVHLLNR